MDNIIKDQVAPISQAPLQPQQSTNSKLLAQLNSQKYQKQTINYLKLKCQQLTNRPNLPLIASMKLYDCQVSRFQIPNCCVSVGEISVSSEEIIRFFAKPENRLKILPDNFVIQLLYKFPNFSNLPLVRQNPKIQSNKLGISQKESISNIIKSQMVCQNQQKQQKQQHQPVQVALIKSQQISSIQNSNLVNKLQQLVSQYYIPKLQIQKWVVDLGWPVMSRQFVIALFSYTPTQQKSVNDNESNNPAGGQSMRQEKQCDENVILNNKENNNIRYIAWKSCTYVCEYDEIQNVREEIVGGIILQSITDKKTKVTMMVQAKMTMAGEKLMRNLLHSFAKSIYKIKSHIGNQ